MMPPMQTVMAERAALAERFGVAELAFCFGFPYADFVDCGAALAAFADTRAAAAMATRPNCSRNWCGRVPKARWCA